MDQNISAGILAGGRSSRMGEDKAFLRWGTETFLEKIIRECCDFPEILVSVDHISKFSKYQDKKIAAKLVEDVRQGYGPLEGIRQLLLAARGQYVLILATDMPLIHREFLGKFCGCLSGEKDCLILRRDGQPQPLCAIYSKKLLPAIQEMMEQDIHKIRLLFEQVNARYVDLESLGYGPDCVDNLNTREEYDRALTVRGGACNTHRR